jgi:putative RecB family exonuclease
MSDWKASTGVRSVSQLQNLARCGHAYYLQKVRRVPQRTAGWFIQGTAVHSAVELYEGSWRTVTPEEAVAAFEWHWDHDLAEAEAKQPDSTMWMVGGRAKRETDLAKRRDRGRQQVVEYIEANGRDSGLVPAEIIPDLPAVEVGFELDFDGVIVIGFIDLVLVERSTGRLKVRDIKTGSKEPSDPYQMATYGLAVERLTGQKVEWGDWWMCKDGKATVPLDLRPYSWETVAQWYKTMDSMIKAGHFLGNPGDPCFTCTSKPYCGLIQPNPLPWPVIPPGQDFS